MKIETLENKTVEIIEIKTTFMKLKVDGKILHYNFINRIESRLKSKNYGELQYFTEHPLLRDYSENHFEVFINSKPSNPEKFIAEFKDEIRKSTFGWRNWEKYVLDTAINFTIKNFIKNVEDGNGKILVAPKTIVENIAKICDKNNVKIKSFENSIGKHNYKLIVIDKNYVIADEFENV